MFCVWKTESYWLLWPFPWLLKKKKGISKYSILTPKINTMMNSFYFCFCFWGFFIKKKKLSFPRLVLIEFKQSVKERKIKEKAIWTSCRVFPFESALTTLNTPYILCAIGYALQNKLISVFHSSPLKIMSEVKYFYLPLLLIYYQFLVEREKGNFWKWPQKPDSETQ